MRNLKRFICICVALLCLCTFISCDKGETESTEGETENGVAMHIVYNGTKITLGAKADAIIDALGEPQERREIGDCGGLGAQVRYSYPSIEVYVLESKTEGNIIDQITLRDDLVSTPEGVCIGESTDKLMGALGEHTTKDDRAYEYVKGSFVLRIGYENGVITEIDYITD